MRQRPVATRSPDWATGSTSSTGLGTLRDAGVRLSLDDFGTGSSMSAMSRTAVDEVEVDRSFVDGAPNNPRDRAVIAATVALADGLGLPVVAEGIETEEQLQLVRDPRPAQGRRLVLLRASRPGGAWSRGC